MSSLRRTAGWAVASATVATLVLPAPPLAAATTSDARVVAFAPVDRPGPKLSVPARARAGALKCSTDLRGVSRRVTLFVPGTTLTPEQNFGWNWFPAMRRLGWPYCSVELPDNAMADMQVAAEYVVHAIRRIHRASGRKLNVLGYSQGGALPRFALRFWPDLRPRIADYVSLAATNHGSPIVNGLCPPVVGCAPALWQQTWHSKFVTAMNSGQETFPGISYTSVYSRVDEFVQPNLDNTGTSSLHGGGGRITNVALQRICPLNVADHLAIGSYDPVAYAIAIDALTHAGPADPARVTRRVCGRLAMPGVDLAALVGNLAQEGAVIANELAFYPKVAREPALASYVYR